MMLERRDLKEIVVPKIENKCMHFEVDEHMGRINESKLTKEIHKSQGRR